MQPLSLTLLSLFENGVYYVQCLEHDIISQGLSAEDALDNWKRTIALQAEADIEQGRSPIVDIETADGVLWSLLGMAKDSTPVVFSGTTSSGVLQVDAKLYSLDQRS